MPTTQVCQFKSWLLHLRPSSLLVHWESSGGWIKVCCLKLSHHSSHHNRINQKSIVESLRSFHGFPYLWFVVSFWLERNLCTLHGGQYNISAHTESASIKPNNCCFYSFIRPLSPEPISSYIPVPPTSCNTLLPTIMWSHHTILWSIQTFISLF